MTHLIGDFPGESEPPSIPPGNGDEQKGRPDLTTVLGVLGGLAALVAALKFVPSVSFFGRGIAVIGVLLMVVQFIEVHEWREDGTWDRDEMQPMLRHIVGLRLTLLFSLVGTGFLLESPDALLISFIGILIALFISHVRAPRRLKRRTTGGGGEDGGHKQSKPRRWLYDEEKKLLTLSVSRSWGEALTDFLNALTSWRRLPRYATIGVALLLIMCSIALAGEMITGKPFAESSSRSDGGKPPPPALSTEQPQKQQTGATSTQNASPTTSTVTSTPSTLAWDGSCRGAPTASADAKGALTAFVRLYASESHLTGFQEGCVGQIAAHHYHREFYATAIGANPLTHERLSYSIDSERYGSVLVLWSVAPLVQRIVSKVGPVGGVERFPDYEAGGEGDYYMLRSPRGTYVFIRKNSNESFHELRPTVARAWFGDMKEVKKWLWPSWPEKGRHGELIFRLRSAITGRTVGTVRLHKDGHAVRNGYSYPVYPAHELDLVEMLKLAAGA